MLSLFGLMGLLPARVASMPGWARYLLAFTSACTVAVLWEFGEFASDRFLGTTVQRGLSETMLDLWFGVVGAVVTLLLIAVLRTVRRVRTGPRKSR